MKIHGIEARKPCLLSNLKRYHMLGLYDNDH